MVFFAFIPSVLRRQARQNMEDAKIMAGDNVEALESEGVKIDLQPRETGTGPRAVAELPVDEKKMSLDA